MIKITARHAALQILHKVFTQEAYANLALNEVLQKQNFSTPDRRFITEIVYGTVKYKLLLENWLKKFVPKFSDLPPWIALNLLMAVYQMRFLDRVPASAIVNEAVNLAKRYGHKGTVSLTNAVLRNMLRREDAFQLPNTTNVIQALSVKYSHPEWIVEKFIKLFGIEETEKLLVFNNINPPLTIRVNNLKTTREQLLTIFEKEGIKCTLGKFSPFTIEVQGMPSLKDFTPFKEGLFQIQDESSTLAGIVVDPKPGDVIIDACAAPGGKTTHLAQLMNDEGKVLAFDLHEHKIGLIQENARRLGLKSIQAMHADARELHEKYREIADRVLVDAPCSGLGVLRRRPDSRWRKDITNIKELSELQLQIITSAAQTLKKGGVLVYSTCTLLPEENFGVVEKFLEQSQDYYLEDITPYFPVIPEGSEETLAKGYVTLYPHIHHVDGFFISRMRRKQ